MENNNEQNKTVVEQEQKEENKKARKKITLLLAGLGFVGLLYGGYWFAYGSKFEETDDAYISADQNNITAQVAANVIELNIQDGQKVKQGDLTLKLDQTDYLLALQKAKSDLAKAVRSYGSLQQNLSESQNSLSQRLSDLSKAEEDYNRDTQSYQAGVLSKENWLNTKHKYELAQLAVQGAKASYSNTKIQAIAKDVYNHPDVARAINNYKQAFIDLTRTEVRSPVDGVIAKRAVYIGQKVAPNQNLFTVINLQNEWIDANLKESQLKNVKIGQEVELVSDVNNKKYKGYVTSIGAGSGSALSLLPAQNATGNWIKIVQRVPVRIDFDNQSLKDNGVLPAGTSMRVNIDTRTTTNHNRKENVQKTNVYQLDEKQLKDQIENIVLSNIVWK